jgi:hypothetical protein
MSAARGTRPVPARGVDEDPVALRKPHRRTRGRFALANSSRAISILPIGWRPETDLVVVEAEGDDVGSHLLVGVGDKVRVITEGERWPVREGRMRSKAAERRTV